MIEPVFAISGVDCTITVDGVDSYTINMPIVGKTYTLVNGIITDPETGNTREATQEELDYIPYILDLQTKIDNTDSLSDLTVLQTKMSELKAFLSDPIIQTALDRPNSEVITTQDLNRVIKEIIRQQRRTANFQLRLARYVFGTQHQELLDDVSDV